MERRLRQPGKSASAQDEQLLRAIVTGLTNEEQAFGLQQPAGVGQRPKPMNASVVNLEDGSQTGAAVNVNTAYATRAEPPLSPSPPPPPPLDSDCTPGGALERSLKSEELRAIGASRFHQPPRRAALGPRLNASAAGSRSRLNVEAEAASAAAAAAAAAASGLSPLVTSLALEQQKILIKNLKKFNEILKIFFLLILILSV